MTGENSDKNSEVPVILIVDDSESNLQVLAGLLLNENYEIAIARNGMEALNMVSVAQPHLILLDVMLPELDGFETCRRLKKNPETENIPVIFLSAKTESEDIINGFEAGAVDYITKPFNSFEVLARVRTQMELRFSVMELEKMNKERRELLHILCHDMTNPIGFIRNSIILLKDGTLTMDEIMNDLLMAAENSLNVIDLIRNLMAIEEKKFSLDSVNLREAVDTSLTILKHKIDRKKIHIEIDVPGDIHVLAEKVSFINSVILNILTNAIKFSFRDSSIRISASKKESDVEISIEDSGIGIPDNILKNIFNFTHSASRPGTEEEEGTGFGMPLVKKFIDIYGGYIMISSLDKSGNPSDRGTTVLIQLKQAD